MRRLFALWVSVIVALWPVPAHGQEKSAPEIPKEKMAEIQKMLKVIGMDALMYQMKTQMLSGMKAQMPKVPGTYWERFEKKFDTSEFLQMVIPLYDKYYSTEDLKAINAFYESAAGKKVLSTLPQLMQESMLLGQEWGKQIGARVQREVEEEFRQKKDKPKEL